MENDGRVAAWEQLSLLIAFIECIRKFENKREEKSENFETKSNENNQVTVYIGQKTGKRLRPGQKELAEDYTLKRVSNSLIYE